MNCQQTLAITSHRVLASDLNEHETFYGGRLLELLDSTASISASHIARTETATASLDHFNFIAPLKLKDFFYIETYVSGVGNRSIEIFAKIIGEHLQTGDRFLGATAFLTFVTLNKKNALDSISPLSEEERAVCSKYSERKQKQVELLKQQKEFRKKISLALPWQEA
ncbi:acyl-coa hydrolase [Liquorilactobacillus aquaticus DSM 21051]|uniref:Acyl-coa hydrolase n=1 Tax=Liquorilactobacillus aquaticus DSM 21051 TaxID=1423725 RepID=A0A0R2CZW2_9LACO|nr:acyl-CoA thioesterase [Liquorilactobacillus aquaticus]KRM96997.1 acyl-coa hydrolase [Liquorilactobacillus aquaticus DSM 21051]